MKSQEKIIQIIEKAISDNSKMGSLKDQSFIMPSAWPPILTRSITLFFIIFTVIVLPIIINTFATNKNDLDRIMYFYLLIALLSFIFLYAFTYNYFILDIKNKELYTSSKLFNKFSFLISNYVNTKSIKTIILKSGYDKLGGKGGNVFCDSIFVLSSNGEEIPLSEAYPFTNNHDILVERCRLLSEILEVEYLQKGEKEIKEFLKKEELTKKSNKILRPLLFIIIVITFSYIIYNIIYDH